MLQSILVVILGAAAVTTAAAQSLLLPPEYSSASIVNAASQRPARFAPNSIVTIYGVNLSSLTWSVPGASLFLGAIPTILPGDRGFLHLSNVPMPLFFASPTQINFLISPDLRPGTRPLQVSRDLVRGPTVSLTISPEAPEFFRMPDGFAAATHPDGRTVNAENPARPGDIIVVYGTGFGAFNQQEFQGLSPSRPLEVRRARDFTILIDGKPLPPDSVFYIGVTPHFAGLYQVNLRLPALEQPNPTIEVSIDGIPSAPDLRLAATISATPAP